MSTNSEFELLQMVSEPNTRQCANDNVKPSTGVDCEIPNRHVLKP